jgi:hypothetical protein
MKNEVTMFGRNFKYVLALTVLAWIVYTMPMVRAALGNMNVGQSAAQELTQALK